MPKTTATEITALGFTKEMYRHSSDAALEAAIDALIAEQAAILEGRIGSAHYASTTAPTVSYVKAAEKNLILMELLQWRINIRLGDVHGSGEGFDLANEERTRDKYATQAEYWTMKIVGDDYSGGVLETCHFEEDEET